MKPLDFIRVGVSVALEKAGVTLKNDRDLNLERPKQEDYGDFATPVAMNLAGNYKMSPRKLAEKIVKNFPRDPNFIEKIEIAGPGFINFHLANACLQNTIFDVLQEGDDYGKSDWGGAKKNQIEFVSANPTGPLNVVSARAAAVGDVLANCFDAVGYRCSREYYVNDAGRQIRLLGASLSARYMEALGKKEAFPEDGYRGAYLRDLANEIAAKDEKKYASLDLKERQELFSKLATENMLERHQESMEKYRLHYDVWFRESSLRGKNAQGEILKLFEKKGLSYVKDGAVWFKSSEFGDEKDRVLLTGEDEPTYFLIDIAYHQDKYNRGFESVLDIWGPDHHGYIDRMRAAVVALGHPGDSFEVCIVQQVNLLRSGKTVKMSKRAGEIVEMDELIDEVGVDAARYFFIDRRISQPLDFDIDLAKKQSDENPVYYVQYAHARVCNILRFAQEQGIKIADKADTSLLNQDSELQVLKKIIDFPENISKVVRFKEPHRLTNYLQELATIFHRFYHDHRVVTDDLPLTHARLLLAKATRQVLANGFRLLGISAPENM